MAFRRGASRRVGRVKRPFARTGTARRKQKRTKVTRRSGARKSYSGSPMTSRRGKAANRPRTKTMLQSGQPRFANLPDGALRISHREYVKDIIVTTSDFFLHEVRYIQPGDSTMAPWLAKIAQNFQTYSIQSMAFHFNSTSAAFAGGSNQALGEIIGAYHDNVSARTPINKQALLQLQKSLSVVVSNNATFPIPASSGFRYVRGENHALGATHGDRDSYDEGIFYVATQGVPYVATPINIGELWISYDIVLSGKSSSTMTTGNGTTCSFAQLAATGGSSGSRTTNPAIFDPDLSTMRASLNGFAGCGKKQASASQNFYLPMQRGSYLVNLSCRVRSASTGATASPGNGWNLDLDEAEAPYVLYSDGNRTRCRHVCGDVVGSSGFAGWNHNGVGVSIGTYVSLWSYAIIVDVDPSGFATQSIPAYDNAYNGMASFGVNSLPCSTVNADTQAANVTDITMTFVKIDTAAITSAV